MRTRFLLAATAALLAARPAEAQPPEETFKIFQFPANAIPRVDGDPADWSAVGDDYVIDTSKLAADDGSGRRPDPKSLDVRVRVGWVKGLNRLYFLYEASDDVWDFGGVGLRNDIFELAVDGDRSGGPFIARFHPDLASRPGAVPDALAMSDRDAWFGFQNVHAQNYHIFTPPGDKDWAMAWGPQAGWLAARSSMPLEVHLASRPANLGKIPFEFAIAMGVRRADTALRDELDAILVKRRADIDAILAAYSVPRTDAP